MALFIAAIVSLAASIGPPGSAKVIASPAIIGALTMRVHSSSSKSILVVTAGPSGRLADTATLAQTPTVGLIRLG